MTERGAESMRGNFKQRLSVLCACDGRQSQPVRFLQDDGDGGVVGSLPA